MSQLSCITWPLYKSACRSNSVAGSCRIGPCHPPFGRCIKPKFCISGHRSHPCLNWMKWNSNRHPAEHVVFSSPVKSSFFYLKTRQLATATGLDRFRYSGTATGPLKTGPNRSTTGKKPVQTGWDRFFVVKFIVPNKSNITSCKLHIWIDILILCRLV